MNTKLCVAEIYEEEWISADLVSEVKRKQNNFTVIGVSLHEFFFFHEIYCMQTPKIHTMNSNSSLYKTWQTTRGQIHTSKSTVSQ